MNGRPGDGLTGRVGALCAAAWTCDVLYVRKRLDADGMTPSNFTVEVTDFGCPGWTVRAVVVCWFT